MWNEEDKKFMRLAIGLAAKGRGHVGPNPMVGAVIVKDGQVIAEGWHKVYGSLHAETDALSSCKTDTSGAVMYVTLEPCCHYGKQPPCTDAIIRAGISKVVVGMTDPNPLVAGHGLEILRNHGIVVSAGLFEKEIAHLNRIFIKYITSGQPWVVLKSAMTLDGRIAAVTGDSRWVSGEESRRMAHELRGRYMGIVAGIGTVMADDPMLNCRIEGMRQPVRIVIDSGASLPLGSRLVETAGQYRTVVAHTPDAAPDRLEGLKRCGVELLECAPDGNGRVDIGDFLKKTGALKLDSLLVEGGSELDWSFVSGGYVDEYYVFVAPKIIGGRDAKGPVGGDGFPRMADALHVSVDSVTPVGEDWLVHGFSSVYKYDKKDTQCLQEL